MSALSVIPSCICSLGCEKYKTACMSSEYSRPSLLYTGGPKITEQSIFYHFALINSYLFSPCWMEHLFLIIITPRTSNSVDKLFNLWVISYGLSFSGFAINFSLVGGPPKNGTVNFLELCSDEQLFFSPCWNRASFPHYNDTKIIKFGWKLFILWVISYPLSILGFAINLSSCLEILEIVQITIMTVHKQCLIK